MEQLLIKHRLTVALVAEKPETSPLLKSLGVVSSLNLIACESRDKIPADCDVVIPVLKRFQTTMIPIVADIFSIAHTQFPHKLLFFSVEDHLTDSQKLCLQELGVDRFFIGAQKLDQLKTHLKSRSQSIMDQNSLPLIERELRLTSKFREHRELDEILEKLKTFPKDHEEALRLKAIAYGHKNENNLMVHTMKQILALNPQNLWAANSLGQFYLQTGKIAEGIDLLQKISGFHDLNTERILTLGEAYLNSGQSEEAKENFKKGDQVSEGSDERFKTGLAKVELAQGNLQEALALIGKKYLSESVLSFLNTRAIIAVRSKNYPQAFKSYQLALDGCDPQSRLILSKLKFNVALAHVRKDDLPSAARFFQESYSLSDQQFEKSKSCLTKVQRTIEERRARSASSELLSVGFGDGEWEAIQGQNAS